MSDAETKEFWRIFDDKRRINRLAADETKQMCEEESGEGQVVEADKDADEYREEEEEDEEEEEEDEVMDDEMLEKLPVCRTFS